MANFNIDELTLEYKDDGTKPNLYVLKVLFHSDKPVTTTEPISTSIDADKIILDPKRATLNENFSFSADYDFTEHSDVGSKEKVDLEVWLKDDTAAQLKRKKGGVLVIDTIYPPPNGAKLINTTHHYSFSNQFKIIYLSCKRETTASKIDTFTVSVKMTTQRNFSSTASYIIVDTEHEDQRVLLCNVTGDGTQLLNPKTISFDFKVNFDLFGKGNIDYRNGMPIIIKPFDVPFSNLIDVKKGSIVVKNSELLPFI